MAEGAGASATLTWLAIVTLVALVSWYQPSLFLYWLGTRGDLEELTEADLRRGGDPERGGSAGTT
ncbi:hypothetical protein ABZ943_10230 [Streptomyces rubiginosohelvolus]|uniref:hypothetical protein n=1 Tax=Streptomyces rubiginosohelvolus TaxID=67362 RepID=UPI0033F1E249